MEDVFDDEVLDELFETRSDGFQSYFVKHFGESEEMKKEKESENKLIDTIKTKVKDKEIQKQIIKLYYEATDDMVSTECFWMKQYYKLGFADRGNLMKLKQIDSYEEFKKKQDKK